MSYRPRLLLSAIRQDDDDWSLVREYSIDPSKHVLILYNENNDDSVVLADYYVTNRPGMGFANTFGLNLTGLTTSSYDDPPFEQIPDTNYNSHIRDPVYGRFVALSQQGKNILYVICIHGMPTRLATSGTSVAYLLSRVLQDKQHPGYTSGLEFRASSFDTVTVPSSRFLPSTRQRWLGTSFLVTYITANDADDVVAYIDKIKVAGQTGLLPGSVVISGIKAAVSGVRYVFDDVRKDDFVSYPATQALSQKAVQTGNPAVPMQYAYDVTTRINGGLRLIEATDVRGYASWGVHAWKEMRRVCRADYDGANFSELAHLPLFSIIRPRDIRVDATNGKIYWTDHAQGSGNGQRLVRSDLDGTNITVLVRSNALKDPDGLAVDFNAQKIYVCDSADFTSGAQRSIKRFNLDGSGGEEIISQSSLPGPPFGIDLDLANGKLYWCDDYGMVHQANLNGTGIQNSILTSQGALRRIRLDVANSHFYFTSKGLGEIRRGNFNDSNVTTILSDLRDPYGLSLDLSNGKIYWCEQDLIGNSGRIARADLNGDNVDTLLTWARGNALASVTNAYGLEAVPDTVNPGAGHVYFCDYITTPGREWPRDDLVSFSGRSGWFIAEANESFNGQRPPAADEQNSYVNFFRANAFGGANYSATPVGCTAHTAEPGLSGTGAGTYFAMWELGWTFAECAWGARTFVRWLVVGDPFVKL